jgi:hypothetical protein
VKCGGYKPFQKRIKSDHRGLFLDFDTNLLFGNDTPKMGPHASRDFTSRNPANNSAYIEAKHSHLIEQDFFCHLAHLQTLPDGDHALAEQLDSNLLAASECASKKVKRLYKLWWSMTITKAHAVVDILQPQLSGYKTNTDVRDLLIQQISEFSLDLTLPNTQQECKLLYKQHLTLLKEMEKTSLTLRHDEMEARSNVASLEGKRKRQPR